MKDILAHWVNRYFAHEEALILLLLFSISVVLLIFMSQVFAPFIAAAVIAFLLQGLVGQLEKRGVKHLLAVSIAFSLLVGLISMSLVVLLPSLWQQAHKLLMELPNMLHRAQQLLQLLPEHYPELVSREQIDHFAAAAGADVGKLGQSILTYSLAQLTIIVGLFVYLILVPILVFFFLKDHQQILRWLTNFLPAERPVLAIIWQEMNQQIANYVRGKCVQIILVSLVSSITFSWLGLNYGLLLGVLVGISVIIPYVGAAIVTAPVVLVGYFQWGWSYDFFVLLGALTVIHTVDGNIVVPILFSEAVKIHPVAIIMATLAFGSLLGVWGVFFAIPLATLINAIIKAWPVNRAVAVSGECVSGECVNGEWSAR